PGMARWQQEFDRQMRPRTAAIPEFNIISAPLEQPPTGRAVLHAKPGLLMSTKTRGFHSDQEQRPVASEGPKRAKSLAIGVWKPVCRRPLRQIPPRAKSFLYLVWLKFQYGIFSRRGRFFSSFPRRPKFPKRAKRLSPWNDCRCFTNRTYRA